MFAVLGTEPSASLILGKGPTTELHSNLLNISAMHLMMTVAIVGGEPSQGRRYANASYVLVYLAPLKKQADKKDRSPHFPMLLINV